MKNFYILFFIIIFLINCGEIEKQSLEIETNAIIKATITQLADQPVTKSANGYTIDINSNNYKFLNAEVNADMPDSTIKQLMNPNSQTMNIYKYTVDNDWSKNKTPYVHARGGEDPTLNLLTDCILYYCRKNYRYADGGNGIKIRVACHNAGGIKSSIGSYNPGDTDAGTYKQLFRFSNNLVIVKLKPSELKTFIEYGIAGFKYKNGDSTKATDNGASDGNLQHFSGLSYTYSRGASSADKTAFYFNSNTGKIENSGSRVKTISLYNIPDFDEVSDPYDNRLKDALDNPSDSITVYDHGMYPSQYADMDIYIQVVDFLALNEQASAAIIGGEHIIKQGYNYASERPNDAVDSVLGEPKYHLYLRYQGRIQAVD